MTTIIRTFIRILAFNRPAFSIRPWHSVAKSVLLPAAAKLRFELCPAATMMSSVPHFHVKCRFPNEYQYKDREGQVKRIVRSEVPAGYISWDIGFDHYDPICFTAPHVRTAEWADPELDKAEFNFNQVDGKVNRKSHEGQYRISKNNEPLNIRGRTGLRGRGVLGRWGPNHAADPIVTRWKRDQNGEIVTRDGKNVLQFVSIQRRDTKEWAIPGGMVDPGEQVSVTVMREFMEEAMDSTALKGPQGQKQMEEMKTMVNEFFANGKQVYAGYVDDPRNTDNSWMETVAFLFHDSTGSTIGRFPLKAGDDAQDLKWTDVDKDITLYASHQEFIKNAVDMLEAYW